MNSKIDTAVHHAKEAEQAEKQDRLEEAIKHNREAAIQYRSARSET